ncbi:uncharacterized protein LOC111776701 [Cucurbita pepo subsp. pepo]|uniref:uncharacterized protein LOC111776701 n=1 Tax=Cucurbita pepo subsp. pepo TaxID=3664 RepID=UPI000C9D3D0E|nr:uncharacterized protein LOC111776701 [Cucurbita pepo subsp. pepo]
MPMDRIQASSESPSTRLIVLSIECLKGSSRADEWTGDMLQTGDIVEELTIGSSMCVRAPFKNGRSGIQRILHGSFKDKQTSIVVRVRRGRDEFSELQACIVPNDSGGKKQYVLRSITDPNYVVGFVDRTESECFDLQASRSDRMVSALERSRLQDGYVSYHWERRMHDSLSVPCSSSFLSILLLPKAANEVATRYNDLEDTLARANAWLNSAQATGVPIVFMNIQTESLLTKISGDTASSTVSAGSLSDLSNLANASLYGFEDYHGVDIGVVRSVRLWYAPLGGELPIEIKLKEGDSKLGFSIGRTEEGFIYVTAVDEDANSPSTRSGLNNLYKEAENASKLLIISRVSNQKVLPWIVSSTGAIRCFDTVSLSQKLSLHRHAKVPIFLHLFLWDRELMASLITAAQTRQRPTASQPTAPERLALPAEVQLVRQPNDNQIQPLPADAFSESGSVSTDESSIRTERDAAGELSFRFHEFSLSSNWK